MKKYVKTAGFNSFPSKRIIRRMGLSDDQDGIMRRYINEEGNWNEHLNRTKQYIENTIVQFKPKHIAVLGSGWLLDLPIDFLLEHCEKIYLYDIRHPNQVMNRYKNVSKIEFITMDITGGMIDYVYIRQKSNHLFKEKLPELDFTPLKQIDRIISLNILNQLDILIIEFLRRKNYENNEKINELRKHIQKWHIESLQKHPSTLITDFAEILYDRMGTITDQRSLIFNEFPAGTQIEEWIWKFDTRMTYYPNRKTFFKVRAQQIN